VAAAQRWLQCANDGDFSALWRLTDPNLRLVFAQDWIWANRTHPNIAPLDRDDQAAQLALEEPQGALAVEFSAIQLAKFRDIGYDTDAWGAASRPRPVAPDHELVLFIDTGGEVVVYDEPTLIEPSLSLLMHSNGDRWLVAGFTENIPRPGWPPDSGLITTE
jgi:hypothetical protein